MCYHLFHFISINYVFEGSLVAGGGSLLPMKETVQSLGWEDTLEKVMATHSKIPWTEEPDGLQAMGLQRA